MGGERTSLRVRVYTARGGRCRVDEMHKTEPLRGLPLFLEGGPRVHPDDLAGPCTCTAEEELACRHNQSEEGCPIAVLVLLSARGADLVG
jgi:hypothetical protein